MGYFRNAFVFSTEPRFQALADAFATCSLRGYKHQQRSLWLLDLWEKPHRGEHYPFAIRAGCKQPVCATLASGTHEFLQQFDALLAVIKDEVDVYGANECRRAIAVATSAQTPTFFFAADDELFDMACLAEPGTLKQFRSRIGPLVIAFEDGQASVTPNFFVEDGEGAPESLLEAVRGAVDWRITGSRNVEGGLPLYENVVALWPKEFGDPGETLGVGTWDPFDNLDRDYRVVFDRHIA